MENRPVNLEKELSDLLDSLIIVAMLDQLVQLVLEQKQATESNSKSRE